MEKSSVAIALPADPERAHAVITRGRRIARALGLEWIALRIAGSPRDGDAALSELVTALGGRIVLTHANDIARAIIELSEREHVRLLVLGRSRRPRFFRLKRRVTDQILRSPRAFDVVIACDGGER